MLTLNLGAEPEAPHGTQPVSLECIRWDLGHGKFEIKRLHLGLNGRDLGHSEYTLLPPPRHGAVGPTGRCSAKVSRSHRVKTPVEFVRAASAHIPIQHVLTVHVQTEKG